MLLELIFNLLENIIQVMNPFEDSFTSFIGAVVLLMLGFFFLIYVLWDIMTNSYLSFLYPDIDRVGVLILRLCWVIIICLTSVFGAIGYYVWRARQLNRIREERDESLERKMEEISKERRAG